MPRRRKNGHEKVRSFGQNNDGDAIPNLETYQRSVAECDRHGHLWKVGLFSQQVLLTSFCCHAKVLGQIVGSNHVWQMYRCAASMAE